MLGIFGSGFGLYGYLPALADRSSDPIFLPARYREKFLQRHELAKFYGRIIWAASEAEILETVDTLVIARRPADQVRLFQLCSQYPNIKKLMLEKPLGPNPNPADILLAQAQGLRLHVRVGYVFTKTLWASRMKEHLAQADTERIDIEWRFLADHFRYNKDNWKRDPVQGGGPVHFYGIQILALLAEIGFDQVDCATVSSRDGLWPDCLSAEFNGRGLPRLRLVTDCRSDTDCFLIRSTGRFGHVDLCDMPEPFADISRFGATQSFDRRCGLIQKIYDSFMESDDSYFTTYQAINRLWAELCSAITANPA
jgi:predicted dehydrogenase